MIQTVHAVGPSPLLATAPTQGADAPPLMPPPSAPTGDPMAAIYALISKQRNAQLGSATANVTQNGRLQKAEQLKQEQDQIKQEKDEESAASWGIFGKIASIVAIVVSAVAAACSCGAASGLCVAACVISTMAFVEGQANVLTKITGNPDFDKAFQVGCGIGAALCSGGAGLASLGASVLVGTSEVVSSAAKIGQEVTSCINDPGCQDVAMGLGIASAAAGIVGAAGGIGNVASAAGNAAGAAGNATTVAVKAAGDLANGVAEVGAGVGDIVSGQYTGDATDRAADAKRSQMEVDLLAQLTKWVIDGIKESDGSSKRALQTLQGALQTQAQTLVIASSKV